MQHGVWRSLALARNFPRYKERIILLTCCHVYDLLVRVCCQSIPPHTITDPPANNMVCEVALHKTLKPIDVFSGKTQSLPTMVYSWRRTPGMNPRSRMYSLNRWRIVSVPICIICTFVNWICKLWCVTKRCRRAEIHIIRFQIGVNPRCCPCSGLRAWSPVSKNLGNLQEMD